MQVRKKYLKTCKPGQRVCSTVVAQSSSVPTFWTSKCKKIFSENMVSVQNHMAARRIENWRLRSACPLPPLAVLEFRKFSLPVTRGTPLRNMSVSKLFENTTIQTLRSLSPERNSLSGRQLQENSIFKTSRLFLRKSAMLGILTQIKNLFNFAKISRFTLNELKF